jgi:hypothetical protein
MYVAAIHEISNPEAFWGGQLDLPAGSVLRVAMPSADGTRGVCVFTSDSIDTVRAVVDGATAAISKNQFYAVNDANALGLPA